MYEGGLEEGLEEERESCRGVCIDADASMGVAVTCAKLHVACCNAQELTSTYQLAG